MTGLVDSQRCETDNSLYSTSRGQTSRNLMEDAKTFSSQYPSARVNSENCTSNLNRVDAKKRSSIIGEGKIIAE